ncbi:uncharacterized protein [Dysidea avara]|uniref:uncharacterized protein n=1 Tax=Dysidea avara TaxID=196820 RepID=UPI0033219C26
MSHETDAQDLQRFWEVEDAGVTTNLSDKTFLEQYSSSHITWQEDGSYTARFPWKDDHPPLPNSYSICQGRMRSLETYDKILKEQVDRGFIEQVTSTSSSAVHYIPHLPVLKDSNQPGLNDYLLTGPPFLIDLGSIILRFRLNKYGVSTDIEKAFLHISLHVKDRDFTTFLWLSDPSDPSRFQSEEETLQFYSQARSILSAAKFNLRAWAFNSRQLMDITQREGTADKNKLTTVLGVHWNTSLDTLSLTLKGLDHSTTPLTTKREVLQDSSKLFDPLCFLNPISV